MSFRNRHLIKESFAETEMNEIPGVESELIQSDISDEELNAHFEEGEILVQDTAIVEALDTKSEEDEGAFQTKLLAVESIGNRWAIARESHSLSVIHGDPERTPDPEEGPKNGRSLKEFMTSLWERFLEWLDNMTTRLVQGFKNLFATGPGLVKVSKANAKRISDLGTVKEGKVPKISGADNVRVLSVDGEINPANFTGHLPKEIQTIQNDIAAWVNGNLSIAKDHIELVVAGKGIARVNNPHNGKGFNTVASGFFKRTESKLRKIGPDGAKEEQFLIPLINNDYLQVFQYTDTYTHAADNQNIDYSIDGMRYISHAAEYSKTDRSLVEFAMGAGERVISGASFKSVLSAAELMSINSNLGELGKCLTSVERSYSKVMKSVQDLKKAAKDAVAKSKNKELPGHARAQAAIANRVAREAILSTQASYRATTAITKNTARACVLLVKANIVCYN